MDGYWTIKEASQEWGIGSRRINSLCLDGRIVGAIKVGNLWLIPQNTKKPDDARVKSGKYIKAKSYSEKTL